MAELVYVIVCPRDNRHIYRSTVSFDDALEKAKKHVAGQHPDHDPLWFETYPETLPVNNTQN